MRDFKRLPAGVRAVFRALQLQRPDPAQLSRMSDSEWEQALRYCDRSHLTLALAAGDANVPEWVRSHIDRASAGASQRFEKMKAAYLEAASAFQAAGIECAVLKGFAHVPQFVPDVRLRMQYDIDLFLAGDSVQSARDELIKLGYEPEKGFEQLPIDHLPPLVRKIPFEWNGDYFDPGIPVGFELHYRLWDHETERLEVPGLDAFWERRVMRDVEGIRFRSFGPADSVAYAALHALRHLFRGDVRAGHFFELARFLHASSRDTGFWLTWWDLHHPVLRELEAIVFSVAAEWFDCSTSAIVQDQISQLQPGIRRWIAVRGDAPLESAFHPNKEELWLHLSLLKSSRDQFAVARRRLVPSRTNLHARQLRFNVSRLLHHLRTFCPALWSGVRWFAGSKRSSISTI